MPLTAKQEEGLKRIVQKYKNGEPYAVVSGYAGSGKSYLITYAIEALGIDPEEDVCYAAFCGKACNQLQKMGHKNVSTLHKLLYLWLPGKLPNSYIKKKRSPGEIQYKVIVCDEVGMVQQELINDLLQHKIFVIFCGDPYQLPPVMDEGEKANSLLEKPDIFLDEIMRQAQESSIIRLSMMVRQGKSVPIGSSNDAKVIPYETLTSAHLNWADQIIVATNKTRRNINNYMRKDRGFLGNPQQGDKIICTKNYYDKISENQFILMNGTIGYITSMPRQYTWTMPKYVRTADNRFYDYYRFMMKSDYGEDFGAVELNKQCLDTGESDITWHDKKVIYKIKDKDPTIPDFFEFEYGYAVTCHKAQGSSWGKVLLIEERFPFSKEEHSRWIYTGITRAEDKLLIAKLD